MLYIMNNTPPHTSNNNDNTKRASSDNNSNDINFSTMTALGNNNILSSSSSYLNASSASAAAAQQQHYQAIMTAAYCNDSASNTHPSINTGQQTQPQHSMMAPMIDNNWLSSSSSAMTHHMNINPYNYTSNMNTQYQGIQPQAQGMMYDPSIDMQRLLAIQKRELELEAEIRKMEQKMATCHDEGANDNDMSKQASTSTAATRGRKRVSSSDEEEEQEPLLTGYAKIVEVERRHSADLLNHGKKMKKKRKKIDRRGSGGSGGSSSSVARAA